MCDRVVCVKELYVKELGDVGCDNDVRKSLCVCARVVCKRAACVCVCDNAVCERVVCERVG